MINNQDGYTVIADQTLTDFLSEQVLQHIEVIAGVPLVNLQHAFVVLRDENDFSRVKSKASRVFDKARATVTGDFIKVTTLGSIFGTEFKISDEENIGYMNFYFRMVRSNSRSDVGGLHADKWFWDLNNQKIPDNFERVKIWLPLIQDDKNPSLMIIPGSHRAPANYSYGFAEDSAGKRRPVIQESFDRSLVMPAPVRVGEYIAFDDQLIHGGCATQSDRVSVEFTILAPKNGY